MLAHRGGTDLAVVALDSAGVHVWSRSWGGPGNDRARAISVDGSGILYITGRSTGAVDLGTGTHPHAGFDDAWVQSLAADGTVRWSRHLGTSEWEGGTGVATDADGNVYAVAWRGTGSYLASWTSAGVPRWNATYAYNLPLGVAVDPGSNVYVVGFYGGSSFPASTSLGGATLPAAGRRLFLASYSNAGLHRWSRGYGDGVNGDEPDAAVAVGVDGSLLVVGGYSGAPNLGGSALPPARGQDAFALRVTRDAGAHLGSARVHGTEWNDNANDVAPLPDGSIAVVGREDFFRGGFLRYVASP